MTGDGGRQVRLVMPHQLFAEHLDRRRVPDGTTFVLVEHDLMFRQYRFHQQKLVLHRASMRRFADRLREAGHEVEVVETDGRTTSRAAVARLVRRLAPSGVTVHDVVDDWLEQDLRAALADAGHDLAPEEVLETPNFLTDRPTLAQFFDGRSGTVRMQHFYSWQRERLGVLLEDDGGPVGGRWSFDAENRKKLPRGHPVPEPTWPDRHEAVDAAIAWVQRAFPDNPGRAETFAWPTSHDEAEAGLEQFLAERFHEFGPYEDAVSASEPFVFHSVMTPGLNIGLLDPRDVLDRALRVAEDQQVGLPSLEGFVRQVIGWREYMRATYAAHDLTAGRRMRSRNHLGHTRALGEGWWTGETGLAPVDLVLDRVLERGWAHHIERLMVLGGAMCLLRVDPEAVYEWFMEMFVDAYDWVMVPNVYAMSQFAAGASITTKPYVSGSNYLKKMSDLPAGDWTEAWDGLYWTFVRDHQDVFARNPRAQMIARGYDRLDPATKARHTRAAGPWLEGRTADRP